MELLKNCLGEPDIKLGIDGEVNKYGQGRFSTFIKVARCNCKCPYCLENLELDNNSIDISIENIIIKVKEIGCKKITIAGGEPLLQKIELARLISILSRNDYEISIKTNGTMPLPSPLSIRKAVNWIMDWKLESSGHRHLMSNVNFLMLGNEDYVKFMIGNEKDLDEAIETMKHLKKNKVKSRFIFSRIVGMGDIQYYEIVQKLKEKGILDGILNVRFNEIIYPIKIVKI